MSSPKDHKSYTIKGLNKALRKLTPAAAGRLRDASVAIASEVATDAQGRLLAVSRQAQLAAPSVKATRDRVPVIKLGNSKKLPPRNGKARTGKRQTIGDIAYGVEFGGGRKVRSRQFMPWRGNGSDAGYGLYPAVRAHSAETGKQYSAALDRALDDI